MNVSAQKISDTGVAHLSLKEENKESSQATTACFNKSIKPIDSTVSIIIDKSKKSEVTLSGLHKRTAFKYLPFEIMDHSFKCIDGNERDHILAEKLGKNALKKNISFTVITQSGVTNHKPTRVWQERFVRCITEGLQNIFDAFPPTRTVRFTEGKTAFEVYGTAKIPATCSQFVHFIELGSTSYSKEFDVNATLLEKPELKDNFITLGLLSGKSAVHEFIHIGDGVCIGKLGGNSIYFHTLEDIRENYSESYGKPLNLAVFRYAPPP